MDFSEVLETLLKKQKEGRMAESILSILACQIYLGYKTEEEALEEMASIENPSAVLDGQLIRDIRDEAQAKYRSLVREMNDSRAMRQVVNTIYTRLPKNSLSKSAVKYSVSQVMRFIQYFLHTGLGINAGNSRITELLWDLLEDPVFQNRISVCLEDHYEEDEFFRKAALQLTLLAALRFAGLPDDGMDDPAAAEPWMRWSEMLAQEKADPAAELLEAWNVYFLEEEHGICHELISWVRNKGLHDPDSPYSAKSVLQASCHFLTSQLSCCYDHFPPKLREAFKSWMEKIPKGSALYAETAALIRSAALFAKKEDRARMDSLDPEVFLHTLIHSAFLGFNDRLHTCFSNLDKSGKTLGLTYLMLMAWEGIETNPDIHEWFEQALALVPREIPESRPENNRTGGRLLQMLTASGRRETRKALLDSLTDTFEELQNPQALLQESGKLLEQDYLDGPAKCSLTDFRLFRQDVLYFLWACFQEQPAVQLFSSALLIRVVVYFSYLLDQNLRENGESTLGAWIKSRFSARTLSKQIEAMDVMDIQFRFSALADFCVELTSAGLQAAAMDDRTTIWFLSCAQELLLCQTGELPDKLPGFLSKVPDGSQIDQIRETADDIFTACEAFALPEVMLKEHDWKAMYQILLKDIPQQLDWAEASSVDEQVTSWSCTGSYQDIFTDERRIWLLFKMKEMLDRKQSARGDVLQDVSWISDQLGAEGQDQMKKWTTRTLLQIREALLHIMDIYTSLPSEQNTPALRFGILSEATRILESGIYSKEKQDQILERFLAL